MSMTCRDCGGEPMPFFLCVRCASATERAAREKAERERDEAIMSLEFARKQRSEAQYHKAKDDAKIETLVSERDALKADLDALRKHVAVLGGTGKGAALTEKERAVLIYEGASRLWQRTTWGGSDEDVSARVTAFAAAMLRAAQAEARQGGEEGDRG